MPHRSEGEVRQRLLAAVDEAIAVYWRLRAAESPPVLPGGRNPIKQALINLADDIEAFLLHGEPSPDEPYGDDGVDMLATRASADMADELEPDPVHPEPDPNSPAERRKRMYRVR